MHSKCMSDDKLTILIGFKRMTAFWRSANQRTASTWNRCYSGTPCMGEFPSQLRWAPGASLRACFNYGRRFLPWWNPTEESCSSDLISYSPCDSRMGKKKKYETKENHRFGSSLVSETNKSVVWQENSNLFVCVWVSVKRKHTNGSCCFTVETVWSADDPYSHHCSGWPDRQSHCPFTGGRGDRNKSFAVDQWSIRHTGLCSLGLCGRTCPSVIHHVNTHTHTKETQTMRVHETPTAFCTSNKMDFTAGESTCAEAVWV